jgi:hypothetical protein
MIKNIAWNMFKNTGNIDTFLEFKQIRDIENGNANEILNNDITSTIQKVELNGDDKNQWNNNF